MNPDLPRTEESLQTTLAQLAQARSTGDEAAAGQALLQLAFLVKWVRSDNDQPPFERSHTLALEALELFGKLADPRGQCDALLLAAPLEMYREADTMFLRAQALAAQGGDAAAKAEALFQPPVDRRHAADTMLQRAQALAIQCGDELRRAKVLAARGRQLATYDRDQSQTLTAQALALFRQLGHARGVAGCLFSSSLRIEDPAEKRAQALEASRLFRQAGARNDAGQALLVALMHIDDPAELAPLEPDILLARQDAQSTGYSFMESRCNDYLAQIAAARRDSQTPGRQPRIQPAPDPDNRDKNPHNRGMPPHAKAQ